MNPNKDWYTANQPLMLGGQLYMWNRYASVGNLVHMMEAQFTKSGHQNRIDLLNAGGALQPFVVPLTNRNFKPLNEVFLADPISTIKTLRKTLLNLYGKPVDKEFQNYVLDTFDQNKELSLAALNASVTDVIMEYLFGTSKRTYISLDIVPTRSEDPSEWVAEMGNAINCTYYLGGDTAAKAYLKTSDFESRGMKFYSQDFKLQPYKLKKDVYNSNAFVSILDPIFRIGKDATLEIIQA